MKKLKDNPLAQQVYPPIVDGQYIGRDFSNEILNGEWMDKETFSIYDLKLIDILPESLSADLESYRWGRFNFQKKFSDLTIQDLSDLAWPLMGATEGRFIGGVVLSVWCHEALFKLAAITNHQKAQQNETRSI